MREPTQQRRAYLDKLRAGQPTRIDFRDREALEVLSQLCPLQDLIVRGLLREVKTRRGQRALVFTGLPPELVPLFSQGAHDDTIEGGRK